MAKQADELVSGIPATKLVIPKLPAGTIARPTLTNEMAGMIGSKRLTLLSAPAGAGKTTAVVAALAESRLQTVWLSLDEGDDTPGAFLRLLVAALQRLDGKFGRQVLLSLKGASEGQVQSLALAGLMVNEIILNITQPTAIVLDDLHRLRHKQVFELLDYLLERSPENIHYVITTRHDPQLRLSQLRGRGQLAEFRLSNLHFTLRDVGALLNDALGLGLSDADLTLVSERTEGWAAGVRLLALSLSQIGATEDRSALIHSLSASQRFLFDYLLEEVLNHLPIQDREFLIQTSILDELDPIVCDAVTQRSDSAACLERLYKQNLFLTLQEGGTKGTGQYKYHALFAQFLQKELLRSGKDRYCQLHLRAAEANERPDQRLPHLLAAEAWELAAQEIVQLGKAQSERGFVPQQTINWLKAIPDEVRAANYWLDLIESSWLRQGGLLPEAHVLALPALARAEASGDLAGELEALWNISFLGTELHEIEYRHRLDDMVTKHPELLTPSRMAMHEISKAWLILFTERDAEQHVLNFLDLVDGISGDDRYNVSSQHLAPQFLFMRKVQPRMLELDRETLRIFGEGQSLAQLGPYARTAWMALLQGRLAEAEALFQKARRCRQLLGSFAFVDLTLDWLLMNLMQAKSEFRRLEEFVAEAQTHLQAYTHRRNLPMYGLPRWRSAWNQDRANDAMAAWEAWRNALTEEEMRDDPATLIMEGWAAYYSKDYARAERCLKDAQIAHRQVRWIGTWGNAGIDLAFFYYLLGRKQEALRSWSDTAQELQTLNMPGQPLITGPKVIPLLELAVREHSYAEIAQVSLEAFGTTGRPAPLAIPESREILTSREVEVLRLLAGGASNQEIAERLIVTNRTAKAHVSNILQKLQVSSRTEAIARAYKLSLI
jgi:LuxR family maltose regulon positive regulatory protein